MSDAPLTTGSWALGRVFKKMRNDLDIPAALVAKTLKVSQPTVSRIENGKHRLTQPQFVTLCRLYKVSPTDEQALDVARVNAQQPDWRQDYSGVLDGPLGDILGLESGASRFRIKKTTFVPALLQTEAYAAAVIRGMPYSRENEIIRRVELRMRRQEAFHSGKQKILALVNQAAFEQQIGGPAVMAGQIKYLLTCMERDEVSVRMLPATAGAAHGGYGADGTIMDFPPDVALPTVVWCENLLTSLIYEQPAKVETFTTVFDMAWSTVDQKEQATIDYLESMEHKMSRASG